ncbi:MAG: M1 family metallopeptidase, partial [Nanoarchaeota archaeon]|nr:M1 family metallopeptidase [Nanoarchaeota archaeon]
MKKERAYKYYREDFGKLPITVNHMELHFDMYEQQTKVTSTITITNNNKPLKTLELNAKALTIQDITCKETPITFIYDQTNNKIIITFKQPLPAKKTIHITTKTTCKPTKNILEGIYYDRTPAGQPPTQITQCQQWGFQRIVPCIDDMTAKCTYTTTITADKRYTHLISNGDISKQRTEQNGRATITYDNTKTPMAPYLFFLGAGTYDSYKKFLEYPNGQIITLEILLYPGTDALAARQALDILHDSILWTHIYTGPEPTKNIETRNKLWQLLKTREQQKKEGKNLDTIRKEIKQLITTIQLGYQYTGTIYREIAMQNSDFGGMENVGNTTITANRIVPYKEMTDGRYEYMIRVKTHEFYHNINGSEVTGKSPYEIWLNEAVTVHIEKQHHTWLFGEGYSRLATLHTLISPAGGTLQEDAGLTSMAIEPEGFNDTNELITGITYVKAPEFIQMIETTIGKEAFNKGLNNYYTKFKHSNATRYDWIASMEQASKKKLATMAEQWLTTTGYPEVKATTKYDKKKKTVTITLKQTTPEKKARTLPLPLVIFNQQGKKTHEQLYLITKLSQTIIIKQQEEPGFISINRNHAAYIKLEQTTTEEALIKQLNNDDDPVNKYLAFYQLYDKEKIRLLQKTTEQPRKELLQHYYQQLTNKNNWEQYGGYLYIIPEAVTDKAYAHDYQKLYDTKKKILKTLAINYEQELLQLYNESKTTINKQDYLTTQVANFKQRHVKNIILNILTTLDKPTIHAIIKQQYYQATNPTDKLAAFSNYINSNATDKQTLIKDYEQQAIKNLLTWENYLTALGTNNSEDAIQLIRQAAQSPHFHLEQTNDQRALYEMFANNKKKSLQTTEGRQLLEEILLKLVTINEMTVSRLL